MSTATRTLELYTAIGMAAWLCSYSEYHSDWPLWAFDENIRPPLDLGQYRFYLSDSGTPVGFASWAWLNDSAKAAVISEEPLEHKQWNSGENLIFWDFIAPWGHAKGMVRDLIKNVVGPREALSLGRSPDGSIRKIYRWRGGGSVRRTNADLLRLITAVPQLGK